MQDKAVIKRLIEAMDTKLNKEYIHVYNSSIPFQDEVENVIETDGLYYSEPYWIDNLIILTKNKRYIRFSEILETEQWQDNEGQPYYQYIKGLSDILMVYKYNAEISETLRFAREVLQKGSIACFKFKQTYLFGKLGFRFSRFGYSWI